MIPGADWCAQSRIGREVQSPVTFTPQQVAFRGDRRVFMYVIHCHSGRIAADRYVIMSLYRDLMFTKVQLPHGVVHTLSLNTQHHTHALKPAFLLSLPHVLFVSKVILTVSDGAIDNNFV